MEKRRVETHPLTMTPTKLDLLTIFLFLVFLGVAILVYNL